MDIKSYINRELNIPKNQHIFLFGARQTGKTTLVTQQSGLACLLRYNLLLSEHFTRFVATPTLFREEVLGVSADTTHIFVDEIQRVPQLLDEIQFLIDQNVRQKFILTGSSARKLKRGYANLLGGRAWSFSLFPLTLSEIGQKYSLQDLLTFGGLPHVVTAEDAISKSEFLRTYVDTYLREEVEAEALSRNIGGFIRFLSVAAQINGELLNYSNLARDVNLSPVTVKEYFKILEDTLIGYFLMPFLLSERKKHRLSPKFYFFDTGVLRAIQKRLTVKVAPRTFEFGNYFETFLINEALRISSYQRKDFSFSFLRTVNDVEVDLIIETPRQGYWAIEIKSKDSPIASDFEPGFEAIKRIVPKARCICVCTGKSPRLVNGYEVLPYGEFLDLLRDL